MDENKDFNEKDNLKERAENLKNTVSEKAEEIAKEARGRAETFAGKTLGAAEKLVNDLLGKKPEETEFEEVKTDPKDVEISELKNEIEELRDKYVRLYADFDNFKKRTAKEKNELFLVAGKDIITAVLPVIDDFERALKALENNPDATAARDGMQLIYNKLVANLNAKGLKALESIGTDFDVEKHEAITEIPAPTPEQAGKVIDEVEKGYYLNGKLIRFAKVVVGKAV
ncbi:MAG TPA: nucleotide exchange factor GrpE [Chitinophagales bacterium]|nr:nucleotide exchange factor GrpE [Chitinophagales bacterium]